MDWLTWGALIFIGLVAVLDLIVMADAANQIVYERPSFIGLERALLKRVPATPRDCVVQGASKLLTYVAVLIVVTSAFLMNFVNVSGGFPPGERWATKTIGAVAMTCALLAIFLFASAAKVMRKVRYTYFGGAVNQP